MSNEHIVMHLSVRPFEILTGFIVRASVSFEHVSSLWLTLIPNTIFDLSKATAEKLNPKMCYLLHYFVRD